MARENQGLQIALIVFVMLSIVLAVTTFIFYHQWDEAQIKADAAEKEASDKRASASVIANECIDLKRKIGFADTADQVTIHAQYNADMGEYGGNFPEENRSYRALLGYLFETIQEKDSQRETLSNDLAKLQQGYDASKQSTAGQLQVFETARDQAVEVLAARTQTFGTERARFTADQAEYQADKTKYEGEADAILAKLQTSYDDVLTEKQTLTMRNRQQTKKLADLVQTTFEVAHGEIVSVNQHSGTVWINLGRADALGKQMTFSVYPKDTSNLTKAVKKASIEVTLISEEHLAKARIIEDKVSNPILPGDKIHTPVWTPGERKHFALGGFMDIDNDGKSDQDLVRNLITMHGGVVDCETDETGRRRGKMTIDTRYLVLGKTPDDSSAELAAGYSSMISESERLGIQTISLRDLLQQMGWKNQTPVVQFGPGANPDDFRAKPPAGVAKVSTGTVSGLYKPRRPPRGDSRRSGGAY